MYCFRKKNQNGFTLIELLVVLFILSLIIIQIFRMLDFNYQTVRNEIYDNEERQEFKILTSFVFDELLYAKHVIVYHQSDYDVLYYQTKNGKDVSLKFSHDNGIYEIRNGKEEKVVSGKRFDENFPAVRDKNGLIIFNFYSKELNILLDRAIKPREGGM